MTEDEMVGWHHQLNRHGFGGLWELVIGRPGVLRFLGYRKESDTTEQLN